MRTLLFLINPIAGTKSKSALPELIDAFCRKENLRFFIEPTNKEGAYGYLETTISQKSITDVIIAGGDGTINQVINALRHTGVAFGILPMGSGNGLAFSAGIPLDPVAALQIIAGNNAIPTDAFTINLQFACMLIGLGFDAQVAHSFAKQKKRGLLTYTQETLKHYLEAPAFRFHLNTDGTELETEAFFISVANSNQFGNQFTIAPKASLHDGLLDIVVVKKMNKLLLPFTIWSQVTGKNALKSPAEMDEHTQILYFQGKTISIQNPSGALLHIDGDPAPTHDLIQIEILPSAFRLLVPETNPNGIK